MDGVLFAGYESILGTRRTGLKRLVACHSIIIAPAIKPGLVLWGLSSGVALPVINNGFDIMAGGVGALETNFTHSIG